MVEVFPHTLGNSVIRFYLCLSIIWTCASAVCIMTNYGSLYMGTRNETKSGKACQEWTSNSPHPVAGDITDDQFPDNSRAEAKNFCRNPQPTLKPAVWCYTMDPAVEWELCFECKEEYEEYGGCTLADKGASYIGRLDRAISHMRCQPWSDHFDPRFVFPDGSAEKAKNFCRNPLPGDYAAPWCYVPIFGHPNWAYCDICRPFQGQITEVSTGIIPRPLLRAGLVEKSCIAFCITHQNCVVAVIERVRYGIECYYSTSVGGETIKVTEGHNVTQYEISRVCVARAKGAAGYFVNMPNVYDGASLNLSLPWEFISLEECDKKCLQNTNCAMFNYYTKNSSCCILKYELDVHVLADGFMERHIVRCNPALQAINYDINPGISTTLETPTTFDNISTNEATGESANDAITANSEDEAENVATNKATNKAADEAANEAADEANEPTSKDEHATVATTNAADHQKNIILIVIIAVGVLLILVCACCGFAFYRYNKRKTGSDEKKPLIDQTSAKETNQPKTGGEKLTISKSTSPLKIKKSAAGASAVPLQMMQSTPQRTPQAMQAAPALPIQIMKSTPGGTPQAMQTAPAVPLQTMNSTPGGTPQAMQTAPAVPQAIQGAPINVIKTTPG